MLWGDKIAVKQRRPLIRSAGSVIRGSFHETSLLVGSSMCLRYRAEAYAESRGSVTVKQDPNPSLLSTVISPW
jgi:hypothetical protein